MFSYTLLCLICFCKIVKCDYYAGVFNKNDFLVAQDFLYKESVPFGATDAMYGRYFRCPITYFHVKDRLGTGRSPRVQVARGGLGQRFIVLRIMSDYNRPTDVNIAVGCQNKQQQGSTKT